jgi:hypothetical protein
LLQINLALYIANAVKTLKSNSRQAQADLELSGHPNRFPSVPVATKEDWDILQSMDYRTLLCTHCYKGNPTDWKAGIATIYADDDIENMQDVINSLATADRTIHATRAANVLLMATQRCIRWELAKQPDMSHADLLQNIRVDATAYIAYFIEGRDDAGIGEGALDLEAAVNLMEMFHVLESVDRRWGPVHMFKCNCHEFFKRASCSHVLLAGMACDKTIKVPHCYRRATVQQRRKRGRPTANPSELGDEGEARARIRIALQKDYVPPKVCPFVLYARRMYGLTGGMTDTVSF